MKQVARDIAQDTRCSREGRHFALQLFFKRLLTMTSCGEEGYAPKHQQLHTIAFCTGDGIELLR